MQMVKKIPGLEDMQGSGSRSNSCIVTHKSKGRKGARFRRTLFRSSQQIEGTWNGRKAHLHVGPPVAQGSHFTTKRKRVSSTHSRPREVSLYCWDINPSLDPRHPPSEQRHSKKGPKTNNKWWKAHFPFASSSYS